MPPPPQGIYTSECSTLLTSFSKPRKPIRVHLQAYIQRTLAVAISVTRSQFRSPTSLIRAL